MFCLSFVRMAVEMESTLRSSALRPYECDDDVYLRRVPSTSLASRHHRHSEYYQEHVTGHVTGASRSDVRPSHHKDSRIPCAESELRINRHVYNDPSSIHLYDDDPDQYGHHDPVRRRSSRIAYHDRSPRSSRPGSPHCEQPHSGNTREYRAPAVSGFGVDRVSNRVSEYHHHQHHQPSSTCNRCCSHHDQHASIPHAEHDNYRCSSDERRFRSARHGDPPVTSSKTPTHHHHYRHSHYDSNNSHHRSSPAAISNVMSRYKRSRSPDTDQDPRKYHYSHYYTRPSTGMSQQQADAERRFTRGQNRHYNYNFGDSRRVPVAEKPIELGSEPTGSASHSSEILVEKL